MLVQLLGVRGYKTSFSSLRVTSNVPFEIPNVDLSELKFNVATFVLDLLTDRIVAEYTGRQEYADSNFEIVRRLCIFYNAKCMYECHPYS